MLYVDHKSPYSLNQESQTGEKRGILHGVTVAVSKKLKADQNELYSKASSLGAEYRWIYDESCTHLIHQVCSRKQDNWPISHQMLRQNKQ